MKQALLIPVLCAASALGQTAVMPSTHIERGVNLTFGPVGATLLAGPVESIPGAPYSAQSSTEQVQTLADGNRIVHTTTGSVARDSKGRVRREEEIMGLQTNGGEAPRIVTIDDPVAQVHWTLDSERKIATKIPAPGVKGTVGATSASSAGPWATTRDFFFAASAPPPAPPESPTLSVLALAPPSLDSGGVQHQDLGIRNSNGVPARGTRRTRTIPAGQVGNEMPLVITTETWYSPDLKVLVSSKSTDPRMGETSYSLTNIQRSEPAASLFEVPSGYTIRDTPELPPLPPLPPAPPKED